MAATVRNAAPPATSQRVDNVFPEGLATGAAFAVDDLLSDAGLPTGGRFGTVFAGWIDAGSGMVCGFTAENARMQTTHVTDVPAAISPPKVNVELQCGHSNCVLGMVTFLTRLSRSLDQTCVSDTRLAVSRVNPARNRQARFNDACLKCSLHDAEKFRGK